MVRVLNNDYVMFIPRDTDRIHSEGFNTYEEAKAELDEEIKQLQ